MKDINFYLKDLDRLERKESKKSYRRKYERLEPVQVKNSKKGK